MKKIVSRSASTVLHALALAGAGMASHPLD
jgi:hypothetical protein